MASIFTKVGEKINASQDVGTGPVQDKTCHHLTLSFFPELAKRLTKNRCCLGPRLSLAFALMCLLISSSQGQFDAEKSPLIDSLFLAWNKSNHPGGSIAIMERDQIVFQKAYGLASMEYEIPNTQETIFNIGSVSKQFTACGIILLEKEGLLSLGDDIRKHLPEMPDFGKVITIRHLVYHTSGLRSLHALFGIAGWRGDDSRTNEDLNRIIQDQVDLNFNPGDEFLYCNTGYMLMATIIERITGESFPQWLKKSVFDPMGMTNTYVEDTYQRIVPNNATSYYSGTEMLRAVEFWGYVGSGNVHSTSTDLAKWYANFYDPKEGWQDVFQLMRRTAPLNDGTPNNYAFGVSLDEQLGRGRVQHGGSIGGFRSYACVFPEEETSIVVLTNFSRSDPGGKATEIASILWDDISEEAKVKGAPSFIKLSEKRLKPFEGTYWYSDAKLARRVFLENDTLWYYRSANSQYALIPVAKNRFNMLGPVSGVFVTFEKKEGVQALIFEQPGSAVSRAQRISATTEPEPMLEDYVGSYRSFELETLYRVETKDNQLMAYHIRHGNIGLESIAVDKFRSTVSPIIFEFERNKENKITGMYISSLRARNVSFQKID